MSRGQKATYNTIASLIAEIVAVICGFILPRLILSRFGSSYNGLTTSVSQFISVVALLRAGVGGATRAALYKSLADNNIESVSRTVRATEIFMRKVALIFAGFIAVFSCVYPLLVRNEFEWLFSASLVLIISLSTFVQYYFGITYQMLLQADQRSYIISFFSTISVILNTLIAAILIRNGIGIHGVKLGSAVAFSINPLLLNIYVKKHYGLIKNVEPDFSSINQRWDALFHQVAAFVHNNTDIVLLTIFSNTKEISVYTVYYLVANGLKKTTTLFNGGIEAAIGNMIAKGENELLRQNVSAYELFLNIIVSVLFGAGLVLLLPFISIYTKGITDVEYLRPSFAFAVIITELFYILRQPYRSVIEASGRFKETKKFAFTEAIINLAVSLLLVRRWGLIGVLIGTLIADIYADIVYRKFVSENIISFSNTEMVKRIVVTIISIGVICSVMSLYVSNTMVSWLVWIKYAIITTSFSILVVAIINFLFYKEKFRLLIIKINSIIKSTVNK